MPSCKNNLRKLYRQRRRTFMGAERHKSENELVTHLIHTLDPLIAKGQLKIVAGYDAFDGEANLNGFYQFLDQTYPHVQLVYPIHHNLQPLHFSTARSWTLKSSGLRLPKGQSVELDQIDIILTPGVVFGPNGKRIGFGGGYYDRTFSLDAWRGIHFGVGFDFQWDDFQSDPWDIPLEGMLSNQGWHEKSHTLSTFLSI